MRLMTRFAWHKPNPVVRAFFELCFGGKITPEIIDSDKPEPERFIYLLTDPQGALPPKSKPDAIIDCHIGARLIANPDILSWANKLDCPKITFDPSKKSWCFYDLRDSLELGQLISQAQGMGNSNMERANTALVIHGPWEVDTELTSFLNDLGLATQTLDLAKTELQDPAAAVNWLDQLVKQVAQSRILINPAIEVSFPIFELIAVASGCQVLTTTHGCVYDYLGCGAIYFRPYCRKSYASVAHSLNLKTPTVVISFSEGLSQRLSKDLKITMEKKLEAEEVLERVEQLALAGNFPEAESLLESAIKNNPGCPRLLRAKGLILLTQGKTSDAKPWLLESYVLDESNPKTQCSLGILFLMEGKYERAEELLVKSVAGSDNPLVPIVKLVEVAYKTDKYDTAINQLSNYLSSKSDDNLDLKFTLAGLLYKANRLTEASDILQDILAKNRDYEPAQHLLEMIEPKQSEQRQPDNLSSSNEAHISVAEGSGDQTTAAKESAEPLEISAEYTPGVTEIIRQAEQMKRHGQYQEAFDLLARSYDQSLPREILTEMQFLMVETKVLLGDLRFFDANFDYFESTNGSSPRWLALKGVVSLLREDTEQAEMMFNKALSADPKQDMAWAGLGLIEEFKENFSQAAMCYRRALEINPVNMRAVLGFAELAPKIGSFEEALRYISGYLERDPANSEVQEARDRLSETMKQHRYQSI